MITRFLYKQHFYKQHQAWHWQKNKQKLSNILRLNFWLKTSKINKRGDAYLALESTI